MESFLGVYFEVNANHITSGEKWASA